MQPFITHTGLVAPLDRENVDTDAIVPKQFLKTILRTGFGAHLFDGWRYLDEGEFGQDPRSRVPSPDFVLNQPRYRDATILLAGRNFGCGSSREHAPWAIAQYGFRAILAPSYADIFLGNCFKNGVLAIVLGEDVVSKLLAAVQATSGYALTIDLPSQVVTTASGQTIGFDIDRSRKERLLNAWDEIGMTLRRREQIEAYEARRLRSMPWLRGEAGDGTLDS